MFAWRSAVRRRGEQWSVIGDQWPAVRASPQALKRRHIFRRSNGAAEVGPFPNHSRSSIGRLDSRGRLSPHELDGTWDFWAFVVCGFGAAFDEMHRAEDGLDD